ncbi:tyrosine 3-monooxygenase-like [Drosophila busckii]|uniref:tyrosine 3-monooxygenase-like n=1 Tax=Drosophila busckii TaxID=30019 RepID=UPI001432E944|nr:tyrosine 3-monooxygenase-like [Drosophila busckii]
MMAVAAAQKNREMFAIKKSYSIENGYPSRRRSLVDDARFESLVVKQNKQTVLEEARNKANDASLENDISSQASMMSSQEVELQRAAHSGVHLKCNWEWSVRVLFCFY